MPENEETAEPRRETHGPVPHLEWLRTCHNRRQRDRTQYRTREMRWSALRLFVFVTGICVVVLLRHDLRTAALAGTATAVAFVGAIVRHTKWRNQRTFVERLLVILDESLRASTQRDRPARAWQRPEDPVGELSSLPVLIESGPTWPLTEQERDDLDLYGPPVGIFGLLNRTSTKLGARRLRDILDGPCLSGESIQQRQQAVQWLDTRDEQRLGLMAVLVPLRHRSEKLDTMVRLFHTTQAPPRSILSQAVRLWSVLSGLFVMLAILRIAGGQYAWAQPLTALITVNVFLLLLLRPRLRRLNISVAPWTAQRSTLDRFLAVARHSGTELPEKTPLGVLRSQFSAVVAEARIPSLCAWLEWAGLHGMVRGLLNILVFLDLHIGEAVLAHIVPRREVLLRGLSALAELEALYSLACFSAEQPVACYPQSVREPTLAIRNGRHPLLLAQDAVPNEVRLASDKRTWIITGPNAAGKSTFLRMVGVNVLLAQTGAAVAAGEMTWSPVRLITDVRIRDDLAKHESYFLSEVRRLRRLVLDAEDQTRILGLIDEPFRGTNSQERAAAGVALLEHLMASQNLFLIATHEELLAQVAAQASSAENYHFQEHLHDGGIMFDYRLRPGPATTKTALRILEREGYPQSLLERARQSITDNRRD
jgi:hypothetical protein